MKLRKITGMAVGICLGAALFFGSGTKTSLAAEIRSEALQRGIIAGGKYTENGANIDWSLDAAGHLSVSGTGALEAITHTINDWQVRLEAPWVGHEEKIYKVSMGEGITRIGHNIFANCINLKEITIPNSVKQLRDDVFYGCSSLEKVNLGSGVTEIGYNVFCYSGIKNLIIPKQLTGINHYSFNYMEELEKIHVESGNPKFFSRDGVLYSDGGRTLFRYPTNFSGSVTVPEGVTKLNDDSFFKCNLTSVSLPSSLTTLGESVFRECPNLTNLVFPDKITQLPLWTCLGCENLQQVTLPSKLKIIGDEAFHDCKKLSKVTIPSGVTKIGSRAFSKYTQVDMSANQNLEELGDGSFGKMAYVKVRVNEDYQKALQVLKLVNAERQKAGSAPLTMDRELLEAAMLRAAETAIYWNHDRPNGLECFTASRRMSGENIAIGNTTAESVMAGWMNSPGHKANILSSGYKSIGIGCVEVDGAYLWVQCFGSVEAEAVSGSAYTNRSKEVRIQVDTEGKGFQPLIGVTKKNLKIGEKLPITFDWNNGFYILPLDASLLLAESSDPSVVIVSKGMIHAVGTGTATVSLYVDGCPEKKTTLEFSVKPNENKNDQNSSDINGSTASKGKKVTVVWNANGGKLSAATSRVTYKKSYGKLPSPVRKKYAFKGWYTKAKGGTKVTAKTRVATKKKHTLYARWERIEIGKASIGAIQNVKGRKIKISLRPIKGVEKYQVLCSTSRNFKRGVKEVNIGKGSGVIKNLKKGKTYYVKVRGFCKDSAGKKIYGKYSQVKKIVIKR